MMVSAENGHGNVQTERHSFLDVVKHDASDFLRGAAYAAVQTPINGLEQLADKVTGKHLPALEIIDAPKDHNIWTSAGELAGNVADFAAMSAALSFAAPAVFGAAASTPVWLRMGMMGAAYQVAMPTETKDGASLGQYAWDKARDVGIAFGTFSALGAVSKYLAPKLGNSLLGKIIDGGESGFVAGDTDVLLRDALYQRTPSWNDLKTVERYTAFGAAMGAVDYGETKLRDHFLSKASEQPSNATDQSAALDQSVAQNQQIFKQAGDDVTPTQKQLYNVSFRKVTNPAGESIPTLENPGGEPVAQGQFIAQRLDANGQPVMERGMLNQWPMAEAKIAKTYQVDPQTLATQESFIAPTRTDAPIVHMVKLQQPITIQTKWGTMQGRPGDWLANYDYNAETATAGHDYAIVSATSFSQTYQPAPKAK